MARSDLLLKLVEAATGRDDALLRRTLDALVAEERRKQHHVLADQIARVAQSNIPVGPKPTPLGPELSALVHEISPSRGIEQLVLPDAVRKVLERLAEEQRRRDLLRTYGLEPRHRVLLVGPPGNGKTSLAEAIAFELQVPLLTVRYEGVIGSFLGETSTRLRKVFEHSRQRHCVLFFDEFDAVGKERGDTHETGEIKRVVNSLLLQIDSLPSHVVVVAATNHDELLDRAVWRRFQIRLELPKPTCDQIGEYLRRAEHRHGLDLSGLSKHEDKLRHLSFSDLEELTLSLMRRQILDGGMSSSTSLRELLIEIEQRYDPPAGD